jgi:2-methylcitrate dehydratase PrpD
MRDNKLKAEDIQSVVTHVHQGAIDVLGPVVNPQTVHQSKFSMGTVLALIALRNSADLANFDKALQDNMVAKFRDLVTMELDEEVDQAYPQRWIGKVTVTTRDGKVYKGRVDEPKGDPGNTLSRAEIEDKTLRLGTYQGAATESEVKQMIQTVWGIRKQKPVGRILIKA